MPDVMADRRDAPRYPLVLIAEVTEITSGVNFVARTSDVSRSGCYIDTLNPIAKHSQVRLRLIQGDESLETEARVVYVSPGLGMGVRFYEYISKSQLAILDVWLSEAEHNA